MGIPLLQNLNLKGTVIKRIWLQVLFVVVYTTIVVTIYQTVDVFREKELKVGLIEILGVVTGLLLVFRTQIAYDRYWEGRNLWTNLGSTVGTLARLIWIAVKDNDAKDVVEKKTVMNLLCAFALSTKHYLRDEYAHDYAECREYMSAFPENITKPTTQQIKLLAGNAKERAQIKQQIPDFTAPSNTPGEITYYLGAYLDNIFERGLVTSQVMRLLQDSVSALGDYLCTFEKILRTPMPKAYSAHLEHCLYVYILALPVQLVYDIGWYTIPTLAVAAFAILGILGIGAEIENPFGYDDNDLPLDDFCRDIIAEIRLIISLKLPPTEEWMIAANNKPCGSNFGMNALDLASKSVDQVRDILRQHALENPTPASARQNPMMAGKRDPDSVAVE